MKYALSTTQTRLIIRQAYPADVVWSADEKIRSILMKRKARQHNEMAIPLITGVIDVNFNE